MNNPQIVTPIPDRLLPLGEVMLQIGYRSRTSVYRDLKGDPRFPKPIYRGRNVFFLASEAASYVTGQTVYVDGGKLAANASGAKKKKS